MRNKLLSQVSSTIEALLVVNVYFQGIHVDPNLEVGAGIRIRFPSKKARINRCHFNDCSAQIGAGIHVEAKRLDLENSRFEFCYAIVSSSFYAINTKVRTFCSSIFKCPDSGNTTPFGNRDAFYCNNPTPNIFVLLEGYNTSSNKNSEVFAYGLMRSDSTIKRCVMNNGYDPLGALGFLSSYKSLVYQVNFIQTMSPSVFYIGEGHVVEAHSCIFKVYNSIANSNVAFMDCWSDKEEQNGVSSMKNNLMLVNVGLPCAYSIIGKSLIKRIYRLQSLLMAIH